MLTFDARFDVDGALKVQFGADERFNAALEDTTSFDAEIQNLMVVHSGAGGTLLPATKTRLGGIIVGDNLNVAADGTLSVDMASDIEEDNTRPVSSALMYTTVGNINALLAAI